MLNSTRRVISYPNPDRSDVPDPAVHIGNLIPFLDVDVVYNQGTDAARIAAAHTTSGGRIWWTTDTLQYWYDDGATWRLIGASITRNTLGVRPAAAAGNVNTLYFATDANGGTLYYSDGSVWTKVAPGLTEVIYPPDDDYVQVTANQAVGAGTTGAAPTTLITGTSKAYAAGTYWVEFWSSDGLTNDVSQLVTFDLWDGATRLGRIANVGSSNSFMQSRPIHGKARITLTAATHQLLIRGYGTVGCGFVAGDGTGGNPYPAFMRVTRIS